MLSSVWGSAHSPVDGDAQGASTAVPAAKETQGAAAGAAPALLPATAQLDQALPHTPVLDASSSAV